MNFSSLILRRFRRSGLHGGGSGFGRLCGGIRFAILDGIAGSFSVRGGFRQAVGHGILCLTRLCQPGVCFFRDLCLLRQQLLLKGLGGRLGRLFAELLLRLCHGLRLLGQRLRLFGLRLQRCSFRFRTFAQLLGKRVLHALLLLLPIIGGLALAGGGICRSLAREFALL